MTLSLLVAVFLVICVLVFKNRLDNLSGRVDDYTKTSEHNKNNRKSDNIRKDNQRSRIKKDTKRINSNKDKNIKHGKSKKVEYYTSSSSDSSSDDLVTI